MARPRRATGTHPSAGTAEGHRWHRRRKIFQPEEAQRMISADKRQRRSGGQSESPVRDSRNIPAGNVLAHSVSCYRPLAGPKVLLCACLPSARFHAGLGLCLPYPTHILGSWHLYTSVLYVFTCVCLYACESVRLHVCNFFCLHPCVCMPVCLYICRSACLHASVSVH